MSLASVSGTPSPALLVSGDGATKAYEVKFLLDDAQAKEVEAWARQRLALDPHGDPDLDGAYRTTSLYFDTPELDVYHRTPSYKRRKFRVRRYGIEPAAFLERKAKWGDRVKKRRTVIADEELPLLIHPMAVVTWPGHWFHRSLRLRRLVPACLIQYQRTAYVGASAEGPLRLTLDRRARGLLTHEWSLPPFDGGLPLLSAQVILEFKFRLALPAPFKELAQAMKLNPCTVSKYRLCREACGALASLREAAHA